MFEESVGAEEQLQYDCKAVESVTIEDMTVHLDEMN
jgi:hypothetical protein